MPAVVSCPNRRRRSRVPDHLIGKRVKCPGCAEVFTAAVSMKTMKTMRTNSLTGGPAGRRRSGAGSNRRAWGG
jgi:hypothetical protein